MGKEEVKQETTPLTDELVSYAMSCAFHYSKRYSGIPSEDRKDIQADALAKLVRVWHKYDNSKGAPKTFISVVIKNAIRDSLRKHYRRTSKLEYFNNEIDNIVSPEEGENIDELLAEHIKDKQALKLAQMVRQGEKTSGIAIEFGCKTTQARQAISLLKQALKQSFVNGEPIRDGWWKETENRITP